MLQYKCYLNHAIACSDASSEPVLVFLYGLALITTIEQKKMKTTVHFINSCFRIAFLDLPSPGTLRAEYLKRHKNQNS